MNQKNDTRIFILSIKFCYSKNFTSAMHRLSLIEINEINLLVT